jgi:hypothetical protein
MKYETRMVIQERNSYAKEVVQDIEAQRKDARSK